MFRCLFGILFCFSVLLGLSALSDGRSTDLIVPPESSAIPPTEADVQPSPDAASVVSKSSECTCENCTCNPCTCDNSVAYQTVYETETYYERVCDGANVCRLIPRTRQVARRVAVKAARVAARTADVVREVVTPLRVSGGSTGNYVSRPVYYASSVSYGSTGSAYGSAGTTYHASSFQAVQAGEWTPRRVRYRPLLRRWGW